MPAPPLQSMGALLGSFIELVFHGVHILNAFCIDYQGNKNVVAKLWCMVTVQF